MKMKWFFLLTVIALLVGCQGNDDPESTVVSEETPRESVEAVEPTATAETEVDDSDTVEAEVECSWNPTDIIGQWENTQGAEYQFTESGKFFHDPNDGSSATYSGTWECAEGPDVAIVLTRDTWPGETPYHIRHGLIFDGSNELSIEMAPILTGVYEDFSRITE